MASTGLHHAFESLAEQKTLLALDFTGLVVALISQPFRLRFYTSAGIGREHVPDFLVVATDSVVLVDVRPADRLTDKDMVSFAAAGEAAFHAGWDYLLVTGWRAQVLPTLDMLSSQRRMLQDPLGLQPMLLAVAQSGPMAFGQLISATPLPVVARAHALHLIWHRLLCVDLAAGLRDGSMVWLAEGCGHGEA